MVIYSFYMMSPGEIRWDIKTLVLKTVVNFQHRSIQWKVSLIPRPFLLRPGNEASER